MDGLTTTRILIALITGLVMVLMLIVGFFVRRMVGHFDGLQTAMTDLRESILGLSEKFVTQDRHEKDLAEIRALGRRQTDKCPYPDCPFEGGR